MICLSSASSQAETLSPEQVLQRVIDHYPSVTIAAIEIERARQSTKVADSQLGWQLQAQAGAERGVGLFGTTSDNLTLGAGVSRLLDSGSSLTIEGAIRHEDSETVFSPTIPNPATSSSFGVSYRQPLSRNTSLRTYEEAKIAARLELDLAKAESDESYDLLALQVIDLYFSAAVLRARIDNVEESIVRTKRLQRYINNNASIGISEEKDVLQVNAQLHSLLAQRKNLETTWMQQMVSLNRLMERPWNADISTRYEIVSTKDDFETLFLNARSYSPKIKLLDAQLSLADSVIRTRREERESDFDLVLFAGGQNYAGDNVTGSTSESDLTGGLRFEYKETIDKSGVDAKLYQAQLERNRVLQDRKLLLENLHYDLSSILAEIKANDSALEAHEKSLKSENIKVDEAMKRYRSGRIDIDVLITFEDQLSQAKLSLELQRISLVQRHYKLKIMLGQLWNKIRKPEFQDFLTEPKFEAIP